MNKLKEILKGINPELFTEEVQNDLTKIVSEKVEAARKEGYETAISEKTEEVETLNQKLAEAIKIGANKLEKIDEDHATKLEEIVEHIDEDHAEKLEQVIEKIDEDHVTKLEEIVEHIDEDHTAKLEEILEKIDEDHTAKLQTVIEKYESEKEDALVEKVSDYLETYLDEKVPLTESVNVIKLQKLTDTFNEMKKLLVVTDDFVQEEITEAVEDAKSQLEAKDDEINSLMEKNIELTKRIKENEARELLESKIKDMKPTKASFIRRYFEGSSADEISEKLNEAVYAFDVEEKFDSDEVISEAKIDIPELVVDKQDEEDVITEGKNVSIESDNIMSSYANIIKRSISESRK